MAQTQAAMIPYIVRQAMRGGMQMPRINSAVLQRGEAAGHAQAPRVAPARGGGGVGRGFGEGSAGAAGTGGQPLYGGFQGTQETIYGIPIGPERLTTHGQMQQKDAAAVDRFVTTYQAAAAQGMTPQESFAQTMKANPDGLLALFHHPDALTSFEGLQRVLAGNSTGGGGATAPVYGAVGKSGQQIAYDPNTGEALGARNVPGWQAAAQKPSAPIKTADGYAQMGPDGKMHPIQWAESGGGGTTPGLVTSGPSGTVQPPAPASAGKPGKVNVNPENPYGPQASMTVRSGSYNQMAQKLWQSAPAAMAAMQTIRENIGQVGGLLKEPVTSWTAQYIGTDAAAAKVMQAVGVLKATSANLNGSPYRTNVQNFLDSVAVGQRAPSYIRGELDTAAQNLRGAVQTSADDESQQHGALPLTTAQRLAGMGVIPNGYQDPNNQLFKSLSPAAQSLWRLRNGFGTVQDGATVAAASDPSTMAAPDIALVQEQREAWATSQKAQAAGQAAAKAAAPLMNPQPAPAPRPAPAPTSAPPPPAPPAAKPQPQPPQPPPDATQPKAVPTPQPSTPPTDQPTPAPAASGSPTAAPGVAPPPPGQMQTNPATAPAGQPTPAVPMAPSGAVPLPPKNPLPGISQLTDQNGTNVPLPSVAPPLIAQPGVSQATAADVASKQNATAAAAQAAQTPAAQVPAPDASLTPGM